MGTSSAYPPFNAPDYYRTPLFFGKTLNPCTLQSSFELSVDAGSTGHGFNCNGYHTNLLSIYGKENLKDIAQGVPQNILDKNPNSILNDLYTKSTGPDFGKLWWSGHFEMAQWDFTYTQNLTDGFFIQLYWPFLSLDLSDIKTYDLSTETNSGSVNYDDWKAFMTSFSSNMSEYGLNINPFDTSGIGDFTMIFGWSWCLYDSCMLDKWQVNSIATTLKFGAMFPTSNCTYYPDVFALSRGYNGHYACPYSFDGTLFFRNWVSLGLHVSGIFFASKKRTIGMKTASNQNGHLRLASGKAKLDRGPIWTVGTYAQVNIYPGWSFTFGYGYTEEEKTLLTPYNQDVFDCDIVNHDSKYDAWSFHEFHVQCEYNFSTKEHPDAPSVTTFIAKPFKGKRVFDTTLYGGIIGLHCTWLF